jgi:hypothetical protein
VEYKLQIKATTMSKPYIVSEMVHSIFETLFVCVVAHSACTLVCRR